ncbi:MAG TPA: hypothetical protein VMU94_11315 [Streptosporangiaceae bacterium]|nr:hypothetical protein [Streptosporangiaceae bacterium]
MTGIGALGWELVKFRHEGPVVTVTAYQGLPTSGDQVGDPVTCVTAVNTGRSPVTVSSWGLRLPDGQAMFIREPFQGSDPLPYRLEEGASGNWRIETTAVAESCQAHGVSYEALRAFVTLASGKTVVARRKGIQLGPGFPWPTTAR